MTAIVLLGTWRCLNGNAIRTITAIDVTLCRGCLVGTVLFAPMEHTPRHVPARTNDGWPVVGLITALTVALIVVVTVIHKQTYKQPTDPTNPMGGKHEAPAATH